MKKFLVRTSFEDQNEIPLKVENLSVFYYEIKVLHDLSFSLPKGELIGLIGPNGAGKSTLLKACLGLLGGVDGTVELFGKEPPGRSGDIAYVPQRESVDWEFPISALDVVLTGTYGRLGLFRTAGREQISLAQKCLSDVGLAEYEDKLISELSGGQQQRVFIARALAQRARFYLMDEPLAAVDASTEKKIVEILKILKAAGSTCLVVHHDLSTVQEFFDWVILLNRSRCVVGPTSEIFTQKNLELIYGGQLVFVEKLLAQPQKEKSPR